MTQQKFVKLFRPARAVLFGAVLAASGAAFTARELFAQLPAVQAEQGTSANDAPKQEEPEEPPFVGFAALSPEDQARAVEGKSFRELYDAGSALIGKGLRDDAAALCKQTLGADCTDSEYVQALELRLRAMNAPSLEKEATYAETAWILDEALNARPDSWRVKTGVAELLFYLPDFGYMQDGEFVYGRKQGENPLFCHERKRVRKMQLYAEALPLAREELDQLSNPESNTGENAKQIQLEIGLYYLAFASLFQKNGQLDYQRQQTLTDLSVLPDYAPAADDTYPMRGLSVPVDDEGAPVFFMVPDSFEAAKNDGERRQALLNELSERIPAFNTTVCLARASEAEQIFGVQNLQPYHPSFFADDYEDQEGTWAFSALTDSETIVKLPTGAKRVELPPEYDYISLWFKIFKLSNRNDWNSHRGIAREYENRRQFDKAAEVWKEFLERKGLPEIVVKDAKDALSNIVDPKVVIDSSSFVSGTKTSLNLRFRNAVGAEIVVRRLNLDEPMKMVRTEKFWQDYGNIGPVSGKLNDLVDSLLFQQYGRQEKKDNGPYDVAIDRLRNELNQFDLIGEEVARYDIDLESSTNHFDKIARDDFPVDEPGVYLVETTTNGGNKDAAVVWLHDFAIERKRADKGWRFIARDARTGEPLVEQPLEFIVVDRVLISGSESFTTAEYTKQTDKTGSVFFSMDEINDAYATEIIVTVPKEGVDKASAAQYSFIDFQGIWRFHGGNASKSGYYHGNPFDIPDSTAYFRADRISYRPNEKVEFKFFVAGSEYDAPEEAMWAGQKVDYRIIDPNDETILIKSVTLNKYGAFRDSFEIPNYAKPGSYSVLIGSFIDQKVPSPRSAILGGGYFVVEE